MDSRTRIAARVAAIEPFHVMEVQTAARALEAAGRSVIHMEIVEPDFPTPQPVLDAAQRAIADGAIYYTSALGLPELRNAIAAHYAGHYGVRVSPEQVIVTAGSSALTSWTVTATLPDGQVANAWSSQVVQSGSTVTFTPAAWNAGLPASASTDVGFQGTGAPEATSVTCTGS